MKRPLVKIAAALMMLFGFALLAASLYAQSTFVYTNNTPDLGAPNSVSAFSLGPDGALTPVAGSPFPTGGNGFGGFISTSRIAVTTIPGNFVYAANDASNSISGFSIDSVTGTLTPVQGSPFATGGLDGLGISLAVTPDGRLLYAGNLTFSASSSISAFSIASNGALTPIQGSPFPVAFPINMKVTPDGKYLVVQEGGVRMFSIGSNGALTTVPGSPFPVFLGGGTGLDVNCASNLLFVPTDDEAQVGMNVLNIDPNGVLTPIAGSPFTFSGSLSFTNVLSPDDQHLFVSGFFSGTITSLNVASGGSLAEVSGSPFPTGAASRLFPVTMATNQAGTLLYVAAFSPSGAIPQADIIGFNVDNNGALSPVPGSPFSLDVSGPLLPSVAVFPPKSCCPAPVISDVSASPDVLWPPNHKMVEVALNYDVVEPCTFSCTLSVASNEPVNGEGDGNTSPDWQVIDAHHVLLRAERAGTGDGRIYTITITCTNALGKSSSHSVTVSVPHDQG